MHPSWQSILRANIHKNSQLIFIFVANKIHTSDLNEQNCPWNYNEYRGYILFHLIETLLNYYARYGLIFSEDRFVKVVTVEIQSGSFW